MRKSYLVALAFTILLLCLLAGCKAYQSPKTPEMSILKTEVYYRERIMLPPGTTLTVALEDVSKMDVAAVVLSEKTLTIHNAPPYLVDLEYDASAIDERFRYGLRARLEKDGKLLFINTSHIDPFATPTGERVKILVNGVAR